MAKKKVTKKVATSPKTGAVDQKARKALLKAVREDGFALRNADKSLKADREIVLAAVKQYGAALEYAHESLRADREVVFEAVKTTGWAIEYASEELQKDEELKKTAEG